MLCRRRRLRRFVLLQGELQLAVSPSFGGFELLLFLHFLTWSSNMRFFCRDRRAVSDITGVFGGLRTIQSLTSCNILEKLASSCLMVFIDVSPAEVFKAITKYLFYNQREMKRTEASRDISATHEWA